MVAMETTGILMMLGMFILPFLIFGLVIYVYLAAVLMTIANKTNTPYSWLAWIPVGNFFLIFMIARLKLWYLLIIALLSFLSTFLMSGGRSESILGILGIIIYVIFIIFTIIITTRCWWRIAKLRGRPGWVSLLLFLPIVNLVILGILAWKDVKINNSSFW